MSSTRMVGGTSVCPVSSFVSGRSPHWLRGMLGVLVLLAAGAAGCAKKPAAQEDPRPAQSAPAKETPGNENDEAANEPSPEQPAADRPLNAPVTAIEEPTSKGATPAVRTASNPAANIDPSRIPIEEDFVKEAEERLPKNSNLQAELARIAAEINAHQPNSAAPGKTGGP